MGWSPSITEWVPTAVALWFVHAWLEWNSTRVMLQQWGLHLCTVLHGQAVQRYPVPGHLVSDERHPLWHAMLLTMLL